MISGDYVCCSVVFGTLVVMFVFSVMWSELLMTSAIVLLCGHQCTSALSQVTSNRSTRPLKRFSDPNQCIIEELYL